MDNANTDGVDRGKKILEKVLVKKPLNFIGRVFGQKAKTKVYIIIGLVAVFLLATSFLVELWANLKALTVEPPKTVASSTFDPSPSPELPKTPLQNLRGLNSFDKPCKGEPFEIIEQLDDVWGKEKPYPADADDPSVISASESANSQVAKRYPYACKLPWEVRFSFVPLKEQSIGVFIEYEDVFKILLGDGDRQTWKIEKNDLGRKAPWTEVLKEKLVRGKISVNKEVTVVLTAKQKGNGLELNLKLRYVPEGTNDYIWEERTINVEAKATDLVGIPSRPFRIGLNDSRFKGSGSEIQFGIFSIKEVK